MRGHTEIRNMRLDGFVPCLVWVETDHLAIRHDALFPVDPEHMLLLIDQSDNLRRLDLRCVVGLTCIVGGCDAQRVNAVADACANAGAARIITNTHRQTTCGEFKTARVTDTSGALTWPKS